MSENSRMPSSIALNPGAGLSLLRIANGTGLLETEMLLSVEFEFHAASSKNDCGL